MRRILHFVVYLIYRYYYSGSPESGGGVAYIGAITAVCIVFNLNVQTVMAFLQVDEAFRIWPWVPTDPHWLRLLKVGALLLGPEMIIFGSLAKRKEIEALSYEDDLIQAGNVLLVTYIALSVLLFFIAI